MKSNRKFNDIEKQFSVILTPFIAGVVIAFMILALVSGACSAIFDESEYAPTNAELVGELTAAECIEYNEESDMSTFVTAVTGDIYYMSGYYPIGVVLLSEDNVVVWYPYSDLKCYVEPGLG